jgi:hypothetical protein
MLPDGIPLNGAQVPLNTAKFQKVSVGEGFFNLDREIIKFSGGARQ